MYNPELEQTMQELRELIREAESEVKPQETQTHHKSTLENKAEYEPRILNYSARNQDNYMFDLYFPIGIKVERRWFRFPSLNPVGLAYMTLNKVELDQNLRGDFYKFVGVHEIGHLKKVKGYDEQYNTLSSAYDFQMVTGNNYTYLPK